jgi:hypothetical protein
MENLVASSNKTSYSNTESSVRSHDAVGKMEAVIDEPAGQTPEKHQR